MLSRAINKAGEQVYVMREMNEAGRADNGRGRILTPKNTLKKKKNDQSGDSDFGHTLYDLLSVPQN